MSTGAASTARTARSRAEWVSFAAASAVILAVAATIGALWAQPSRPPEVTVAVVGEPRRVDSSIYVTVDVKNHGTETAQDVQVVAELTEAARSTRVGDQVVTFLAGGASEQLVFVIDARFDLRRLTLLVASYSTP